MNGILTAMLLFVTVFFYPKRHKTPSFSYEDMRRVLRSPRRAEEGRFSPAWHRNVIQYTHTVGRAGIHACGNRVSRFGSAGHVEGLDDAQRVMQGKHWFREQLQQRCSLVLTTGGDTANKREDWNIAKTHSNDAVCITDLKTKKRKSRCKKNLLRI